MANIRKTFNFRNGVQVDEDNFIVNPNGLVGIGTSIPSEYLDVRGTAKIVGLVTAKDLHISGVATVTEVKVGTAISITGGGIKATNFYGDGATLSNLPTSQWQDVDVGLGFTSIYAVGNVGVASTDPRCSFQVGGTPWEAGKHGVGINSIGCVHASGIITASQFDGNITGAGITATGGFTGDITGNVTGNVTGNLTGNLTGEVNAAQFDTNSSGIIVSGVTTCTGKFDANGDVDLGSSPSDTVSINADIASALIPFADDSHHLGASGARWQRLWVTNITSNGINVSGIATASEFNVGTGGTAFTSLNTGKVGIGTDIPGADLQIRKDTGSLIEVISESGPATVSIGNTTVDGTASATIRYGNPSNSLNIVNNDTGSMSFYIQSGKFEWIDGASNAQRMSLTDDGKLGIAITNPDHQLHVVGTSTITSNAWIGGNLGVVGSLTMGSINLPSLVTGTNLNNSSGISTFNNISIGGTTKVTGDVYGEQSVGYFNKIGIQTTTLPVNFNTRVVGRSQFDFIGIGTTASPSSFFPTGGGVSDGLHIHDTAVGIDSTSVYLGGTNVGMSPGCTVGIGTNTAAAAIDMRFAGDKPGSSNLKGRFMIPPVCNTSEIAALTAVAGGIVYNSQTNKLQLYNGSAWVNLN